MEYGPGAHWQMIGIISGIVLGVMITVAVIVGTWKVFQKADKPGWAALIPIYNNYILIRIAQVPVWLLVLQLLPLINPLLIINIPQIGIFASLVVAVLSLGASIYIIFEVAARFGKGWAYAVGILFLPFIFIPMLGFGEASYQPIYHN